MSDTSVHGVVERAADSKAFEYTARAGFAASGVLHLLVAFIILRLAFGSGGNADQSGALGALAKQPGGAVMLWVAAVGLLALGLWRVGEAIIGGKPGESSGRQQGDSPAWKRLKALGLAIVNFAIALSAARFAMGSGQSSGQQNAGLSAQLMQSGWGKALLIAVGLGVAAVGGYHVYKGASKKFLKDLKVSRRNRHHRPRRHRLRRQGRRPGRRRRARYPCHPAGGSVEVHRPRRRGKDARSGAVRQVPTDPGRARDRRVRRLQLRPEPARPDVTAPGLLERFDERRQLTR